MQPPDDAAGRSEQYVHAQRTSARCDRPREGGFMRKRAICSILAAGVLLLAQATAALATQPTDAAVTRSMPASLCALLLLTHPGHTSADCVTHHSVRIDREPGSKVGFASPQAATLASAYCAPITGPTR